MAYFSIPVVMLFIIKKRKEQKFKGIVVLFALFILSCGLTHIFSIYTIWNGNYGLHGILKAITAVISALTAFVLYRSIEKIVSIPTPAELQKAQSLVEKEKIKRVKLEIESRASSIFQFSIELFPTGVLVIDSNQKIHIANKKIEEIFGYQDGELNGKNINVLIEPGQVDQHEHLVSEFMQSAHKSKSMASGRLVWGVTKNGGAVPIEVALSVHEFGDEHYTFASIINVSEVGATQEQYLQSSRRLQRAVDATGVSIWEWNLLSNEVWYSAKMLSFLNTEHSSENAVLEDWMSHIHPDDLNRVKSHLDSHLAGNVDFDILYRGINLEGQYQWLRAAGDTIFDSNSKPLLMSGTLTNVDSLKKLQIEIEGKNQFLDAILTQSNSGIYIVNNHSKLLKFTNKKLHDLLGYSSEELQELLSNNKLKTLFYPDDFPAIKAHNKQLAIGGLNKQSSVECRIKHKDGHWIWCLSQDTVYSIAADDSRDILGAITDISDIKSREEMNKKLAKEFSDTFELAAVGIAHVSLDGKWLKVNEKICEILGYTKNELLSKTFQEISYPDELASDESLVQQLLEKKIESYVLEKRYIQKSGALIWAKLTVSMVENEDGSNSHFISVIEDISQQKQLQQDLLSSNEELEQFAYVASHDLKEPLRTLQTYTSYLISDLESGKSERVKQDKEFIDSASKRMTSLIEDLLKFSRAGNTEIQVEECNLNKLIQSVLADLQTKIRETEATISVVDNFPSVQTDKVLLRLAIQNLIHNAIKFTKLGTKPIIAINYEHQSDGYLKINIKDNGIGISSSHQEQIFGLFKKLHSTSHYTGTGLGLAIVKKVMNRLGGDVSLNSQEGQGSNFTLQLPLFVNGENT